MAPIQRTDSPLLTKTEAADFLRVSVRKLEQEIRVGSIAACRIGTRVLVPRVELLRYISDRTAISMIQDSGVELATA